MAGPGMVLRSVPWNLRTTERGHQACRQLKEHDTLCSALFAFKNQHKCPRRFDCSTSIGKSNVIKKKQQRHKQKRRYLATEARIENNIKYLRHAQAGLCFDVQACKKCWRFSLRSDLFTFKKHNYCPKSFDYITLGNCNVRKRSRAIRTRSQQIDIQQPKPESRSS